MTSLGNPEKIGITVKSWESCVIVCSVCDGDVWSRVLVGVVGEAGSPGLLVFIGVCAMFLKTYKLLEVTYMSALTHILIFS